MVLGVIIARGGSKRFPGKNLAHFNGKSLVALAWASAKASQYLDAVIVSTDSIKIANHANEIGAMALMRPKEISGDDAKSEDALRHAAAACGHCDWLVLLQPTSPLRIGADIDQCLEAAFYEGGAMSYRASNGQRNGAVYVMRRELLDSGRNFDAPFTSFYIMPDSRSLDIDYPEEIAHFDLIQSHCAT